MAFIPWNSSTGQLWWDLLFHHFIFSLSPPFLFLLFSGCVSSSVVTDGEALPPPPPPPHHLTLLSLSLSSSPPSLPVSPPGGKSLQMRAHVNHWALMWWLLPVTCQPYGRWHHSLSWYVTPSSVAHGPTHTRARTHLHATCTLTHRHAKTHVRLY